MVLFNFTNNNFKGYLIDVDIYLGKATQTSQREVKIGENTVLRLCTPYFHTNRLICADNFFSSISLCQKLWDNGCEYVGTLRLIQFIFKININF